MRRLLVLLIGLVAVGLLAVGLMRCSPSGLTPTPVAETDTSTPLASVDTEEGTPATLAGAPSDTPTPIPDTPTPIPTSTPMPDTPTPTITPIPLPTWAQPTWTPVPNATPTIPAPLQFFATPLPPAPENTRLLQVQERGWLVVGVTLDVPVFGYVNPNTGGLEGFEVELATHIGKTILGDARNVEYRAADPAAKSDLFQKDELDVVLAMIPAATTTAEFDSSDVYFVGDQALLIPKGGLVRGIRNLAGRTVAVVKGSAAAELLSEQAPQATLVTFDTYADTLKALEGGQAAALAGDAAVLQTLASQAPDRWQVSDPFAQQAYAVAVPKDQPELLDAVNRAIHSFKASGEWEQAYARFVPGPVPQPPSG